MEQNLSEEYNIFFIYTHVYMHSSLSSCRLLGKLMFYVSYVI